MNQSNDNAMNPDTLYREENYTDNRLGAIRKLIPVTTNGAVDSNRPIKFIGSAQIMSQMGPIPLSFELAGATIGDAAENFAASAEIAIQEAAAELEQMRREQASQIVMPGQSSSGGIIT